MAQPLDREQLRRRFKEESARLEKERDEALREKFTASIKAILSRVTDICESPEKHALSLFKAPYLSFTLAEEEFATELSRRLLAFNCETTVEKKHSYTCECASDKDPCLIYLTVVDFWNDPSPERNAQ
jgi:hypothetical protein